MMIRSLCGAQKSHWIITSNDKMNVWKCKLIFPSDTLQQQREITDFKPFLAAENTSVLIILASTVDRFTYAHVLTPEILIRHFLSFSVR